MENYNHEINAREIIQDRQSAYIDQLQDELKNAKVVLQNKYVRNKYYESIKDYKLEIEKNTKSQTSEMSAAFESQKRTKSAHKPSNENKRRSSDGRCLFEKNRTPTRKNQPGPIFVAKLNSMVSSTFDASYRSHTPLNYRRNSAFVL